jgi:hypothetical protein
MHHVHVGCTGKIMRTAKDALSLSLSLSMPRPYVQQRMFSGGGRMETGTWSTCNSVIEFATSSGMPSGYTAERGGGGLRMNLEPPGM